MSFMRKPAPLMIFSMLACALAPTAWANPSCDTEGVLLGRAAAAPALLVHDLARDFLSGEILHDAEIDRRGYDGPFRGYSRHLNLVFVRDYYPLIIQRAGRELVLTYKAPLNQGAPLLPSRLAQGREVRDTGLTLEGGNVLATERLVLTSEKTLTQNRGLSSDEVRRRLAQAAEADVVVLPWLPGERTGHVDMYVGVLGPTKVALPYIPEEAITLLGYEHERQFARQVNGWLEARATELQARGLELVRLPMLPPKNLAQSRLSLFGWDAQFPSPVNWARRGNVLYVPSFGKYLEALPESLRQLFTSGTADILARHGFEARFIEASRLLPTNGLLHCITAEY